MVHRLNAELARVCNPLFRRLGVDLITSRILVIVLEQDCVYVGDIVRLMALPQSTVSHQVKRLAAAGLVTRTSNAADKRLYTVRLTRRGRRIANACNELSGRIYERLFGDMPDEQMQALLESLTLMGERLTALEAGELDPQHDGVVS